MHLVRTLKYCCSKNYSSAFHIRSRLSEFFKHVHPDQLQQAPSKVKDENMRSLKNFNSFIDAINNEKPIEAKLLTFYISQKTNAKSKKFYSFNLQLPEVSLPNAKMSEEKAKKLLDHIVDTLNDKFKESQHFGTKKQPIKEPTKITIDEPIETTQEKFQRMQSTVNPFSKKISEVQKMQMDQLKSHIKSKYLESEAEQMKMRLRQKISFADTSRNKPLMWSRLINEQTGLYKDYQSMLQGLIDPKLIYFAEDLSGVQIQTFKSKMLPGEQDRTQIRETNAVLRVCEQMECQSPPLCFYVTRKYSSQDIPGFFSIPFDFLPLQLLSNFQSLKKKIILNKQKYQQLYDYHTDLLKRINERQNIIVSLPQFKNIQDISEKVLLLQRIDKIGDVFGQFIEIVVCQAEQFRIFCNHYKVSDKSTVHYYKKRLFMVVMFLDQHYHDAVAHSKYSLQSNNQ